MRAALILLLSSLCALCSPATRAWGATADSFACQAKAVPAGYNGASLFSRYGRAKAVEVVVTFRDTLTDCTGAPLELTVMNGQLVRMTISAPKSFQCVTTQSRAPAPSTNSIADLLALIAKAGEVGILSTGPGSGQKPPTPAAIYLDSGKNVTLTAATTCTDGTRVLGQSVKVTYQNPAPVAVSAGVLINTSNIRSYGIKTTQTGASGGTASTQNTVAVTGSSDVQFVPFSFVNIYWTGSRTASLNGQIGIGVNPNLSSPRVEFFAAPVALSWHDVFFSAGFHVGQHEDISGGFSLGENTLSSLSKLPIHWNYYTGLGLTISYNLKPLVKGGSNTAAAPGK